MLCIQHALSDKGDIVSINDPGIERGLKCNCTCPSCGSPLVARKGEVRRHSFAHYNDEERECCFALETELHIRAKILIEEQKLISLPLSFFKTMGMQNTQVFTATNVRIEQYHQGKKPDLILDIGGFDYFIEIAVTHFCEPEKIKFYRQNSISAAEFDLSELKGEDDFDSILRRVLFSDSAEHAYWLALNPMCGIGHDAMENLRGEARNLLDQIKKDEVRHKELSQSVAELDKTKRKLDKQRNSLMEQVGVMNSLKEVNDAIKTQQVLLSETVRRYQDERVAHLELIKWEDEIRKHDETLKAKEIALEEYSKSLAKKQNEIRQEIRLHSEDVREQWLEIVKESHAIALIENDLREEGLSLEHLEQLQKIIRQQADYEELFRRRSDAIVAGFRKLEDKQERIQSDITELLKQRDFYQAEVAKLSRQAANTK